MNRMWKKRSVTWISLILVLMMALPSTAFATVSELNTDSTESGISLADKYTAYDDIQLQVSLTEDASLSVTVPTAKTAEELAAVDLSKVTLSLTRDRSRLYVDPDYFPYAKNGGPLASWVTENDQPMFSNVQLAVEGTNLIVRFDVSCFFYTDELHGVSGLKGVDYSTPHTNGMYFIDYCGYFDFTAALEEETLGSVHAKVVPYDSFRTIYEMYYELEDMAAHHADDRYVSLETMGHTTQRSYDIPYLVVASDKAAVDRWLAYTDLAENDPAEALRQLESGELADLKVPMLITNCHTNENSCVNGILNFAQIMTRLDTVDDYDIITGLTQAGKERIAYERSEVFNSVLPASMEGICNEYGLIRGDQGIYTHEDGTKYGYSAPVDMAKYYTMDQDTSLKISDLLDHVIFLIAPTMNPVGYENGTRATSLGYDPNRDEVNQTMYEDANLQHTIGTWNPMVYDEIHGRIEGMLIEPCTPPHEPNYEYDLIAKQFVELGESLGAACIVNNDAYNSYEMPARDYLHRADGGGVVWDAPWDDSYTNTGGQFPPLIGTCGITWEMPAYDDITAERVIPYGLLGQASYISGNKQELLRNQARLFQRGVKNANSNQEVAPFFVNQFNEISPEQAALMRPVHDGEGENGNFYCECFIIPMDPYHQRNLEDAAEALKYLTRNDVKVHVANKAFVYDGVEYPTGTLIVSMHQAKRSLAHSQLFPGTFLNGWTGLFSESFAQQPYARGYDIITVAEPDAYKDIMAICTSPLDYSDAMTYLRGYNGCFLGVEGADVIIENASEDAVIAVNELLRAGKTVAMITEGDDKSDFICSYEDYLSIADQYILRAEGVYGKDMEATVLTKAPQVFLTGEPAKRDSGYSGFAAWNFNYNFDKVALQRMGIDMVYSIDEADAILGAGSPNEEVLAAAKAGTPYMLWGGAASSIGELVPGATLVNCNDGVDLLAHVTYLTDEMITASYVKEGDDIMYEYGVNHFDTLPGEANVLIKNAGKTPLQGCITTLTEEEKTNFDAYNNGVIAFSYREDNMNVVAFADTLTHKGHQSDEYTFISNFLFEQMMGEEKYVGVAAPGEPEKPVEPETPVEPEKPADPQQPETPNEGTNPETGDFMNLALWPVMMTLSAVCIVAAVGVRRRKNRP